RGVCECRECPACRVEEVLRIHPENQLLPSRASQPRVQHRVRPHSVPGNRRHWLEPQSVASSAQTLNQSIFFESATRPPAAHWSYSCQPRCKRAVPSPNRFVLPRSTTIK